MSVLSSDWSMCTTSKLRSHPQQAYLGGLNNAGEDLMAALPKAGQLLAPS